MAYNNTEVLGKNNAYHNVNQGIYEWILNLIDIVVCVVFALYSRINDLLKKCIQKASLIKIFRIFELFVDCKFNFYNLQWKKCFSSYKFTE
jgi:hypothetical protein